MKTRRSILKSNNDSPLFTFPKEWDTTRQILESPFVPPKACTDSVLETPVSPELQKDFTGFLNGGSNSTKQVGRRKSSRQSCLSKLPPKITSNSPIISSKSRRKSTIMDIVPFVLDEESSPKSPANRRLSRISSRVSRNSSIQNGELSECSVISSRISLSTGHKTSTSDVFSDCDLEITPLNKEKQTDTIQGRVHKALGAIKRQRAGSDSLNSSVNSSLNNSIHQNELSKDLLLKSMDTTPCVSSNGSSSVMFSPGNFSTQPATTIMLEGVTAFVDVRCGAANKSPLFSEILVSLGAEVCSKFSSTITHVLFKDGSKVNFKKALEKGVHLVSTLWLEACQKRGVRVPESDFPATNPFGENLEGGRKRKPRSMQPRPFEEDERLAEARVKKKFKKLYARDSSSDSLVRTPTHVQKPSEPINSPLFGIDHLLTPSRQDEANKSITSSCSSESEISTPLATRMYYKFLSRTPDRGIQRSKASGERVPMSPLVIRHDNNSTKNSLDDFRNLDLNGNSGSSKITKRRSARFLKSTFDNSDRRRTMNSFKVKDALDFDQCENSKSDNNLMDTSMNQTSPAFESRRKSKNLSACVSPTTAKCSKACPTPVNSLPKRLSVTPKRPLVDVVTSKGALNSFISSQGSSSYTSSQASSTGVRRRRLHTVEVVTPEEDLLIPSSPTSPERALPCLYDSLSQQNRSSASKSSNRRQSKGNVFTFPVPKNTQDDPNGNTLEPLQEENDESNSSSSFSPTRLPKKTVRFSMVPSQRRSIEEFRSNTPEIKKKRSSKCFNLPPAICITSVHSKDMLSLHAIIKKLGGFRIVKNVDHLTTHVICGCERRTLNVLHGIARGCWIIDVSWLYESVELQKWAPEEPFELFTFCPGAQKRRLARETSLPESLFDSIGRIYIADDCEPSPFVLEDLLHVCGANIASTLRSADLVLSTTLDPEIKIEQVKTNFVLDSIQLGKTMEISDYKFT